VGSKFWSDLQPQLLLDHAFTLLIPFRDQNLPCRHISEIMSEDISFDFDDSSLLFDPRKYEPGGTYGSKRELQSDDEEMDDQEELGPSGAVAEVAKQGTSSDWDTKPSSSGLKYPNLQVTQNMVRPRSLRRERSPAVDCFQCVPATPPLILPHLIRCAVFFQRVRISPQTRVL
jgi:hypothetical protein